MAHTPAVLKGVIHLRGVMVPLLDMRLRFNLAPVNDDTFAVVIGALQDRRLMLLDIEKLMTRLKMGSVSSTLQ